METNHYQSLHVREDADPEVIKGAYRHLAQKWHPDRNPTRRAYAEEQMKIINAAYHVLSNPERRRAYDNTLRASQARPAPQTQRPSARSAPQPAAQYSARSSAQYSARSSAQSSAQTSARSSAHSSTQHKPRSTQTRRNPLIAQPWARLGARTLDFTLCNILSLFVIYFVLQLIMRHDPLFAFRLQQQLNAAPLRSLVFEFALTLPLMIISETFFISTFACTIGKWLFGIRVLRENGAHLSPFAAFWRSIFANLFFFLLFIPIVAIIAGPHGYRRLRQEGDMLWDRGRNTVYHHGSIALTIFLWIALILLNYFSDDLTKPHQPKPFISHSNNPTITPARAWGK